MTGPGIPADAPNRPVTLRAGSSIPVFIGVVLVCAGLLIDAIVRGRWDVALASLPASALAVWVSAAVVARPCLRITDSGLSIVNILRTTDAPWGQIEDVTTRHQVVVTLRDGARVRSWGAPMSARAMSGSAAALEIQDVWSTRADDRGGVVRRVWHRWTIASGAVLLLIVLVQVAAVLAG